MAKATLKEVPATQTFNNWREVDLATQWRWPNFTPEEIACRGTGKLVVHAAAMDKLQNLRTKIGKPLILNSAYRSPEHNKRVGGEANSYHMCLREYLDEPVMAFDVSMSNQEPNAFRAAAIACGFRGFGDYPMTKDGKRNFMHIDNGPPRRWNLGGNFPQVTARPDALPQRFDSEPVKATVMDMIKNPAIVTSAGTLVAGTGISTAVQNPANPISWVVAIALGLGVIAAGFFLIKMIRSNRLTTTHGQGD